MTALQLAAVLLCILYFSEAAFSVSSTRCCTQLGENISKNLLKKVKSYEIQRQDGTCHLQAVLLQMKLKTLCISPNNKRVQRWINRQKKKGSGNQQARKSLLGRKKRRDHTKTKKKMIKKRKQRLN